MRYAAFHLPSDPFAIVVPKKRNWRPAQSSFLLKDLAIYYRCIIR